MNPLTALAASTILSMFTALVLGLRGTAADVRARTLTILVPAYVILFLGGFVVYNWGLRAWEPVFPGAARWWGFCAGLVGLPVLVGAQRLPYRGRSWAIPTTLVLLALFPILDLAPPFLWYWLFEGTVILAAGGTLLAGLPRYDPPPSRSAGSSRAAALAVAWVLALITVPFHLYYLALEPPVQYSPSWSIDVQPGDASRDYSLTVPFLFESNPSHAVPTLRLLAERMRVTEGNATLEWNAERTALTIAGKGPVRVATAVSYYPWKDPNGSSLPGFPDVPARLAGESGTNTTFTISIALSGRECYFSDTNPSGSLAPGEEKILGPPYEALPHHCGGA